MAEKKVLLTQEGYDKLVEKLEYMKNVSRSEISERLKAAIALGDLSENSEYDDAKNDQGRLENEISELEIKLRNSEIIQFRESNDKIVLGSTVTVRDVEIDDVATYMIVGTTEANPDENKISDESPLGHALLGKNAGMIIQVQAPIGTLDYEILEIQ